ncbi:MAG: UDP-3-O-[3-hydroxymyristoyl] N-acetylglucosamine deacetylase [Elusimicrobia bacterium]|nr:UDP-3-O-[3-hydroxymyristoyl] N-acetylglucosamine deacetylase [Elusimicrobiota bacterium]
MDELQSTISRDISLEGVGLHTGNPSKITFKPAPPNTGIRFFREDLAGTPMIPARLRHVVATVRGTNLGLGEAKVHTVEHVLSACTGVGVDNVDVWVTANEPPIMDGSSLPFLEALLKAGVKAYPNAPKRWLRLPGEVAYSDGAAKYRAKPSDHFELKVTLIHDHPMMPKMTLELRLDRQSYLRDIARARTFCFEHEVAYLRSQGLAQGGSLDNAIVIGKDRFLTNPEGLRYNDEFVRHKTLDLIGDLTLIGRSLFEMSVEAECLGHAHNIEFAKRIEKAAEKMRKNNTVLEAPK